MKVYKNISRHKILNSLGKNLILHIKWALSLKPGHKINCCHGNSVPVISIKPKYKFTNNGWYIWDVHISVGPNGGVCSLRSCGVTKSLD